MDEIEKRYYNVSEVAEKFNWSKSRARFYYQYFKIQPYGTKLKPKFTEEQMKQFARINDLLHKQLYTLKGAVIQFNRNPKAV